jgi:hypothetical protein
MSLARLSPRGVEGWIQCQHYDPGAAEGKAIDSQEREISRRIVTYSC